MNHMPSYVFMLIAVLVGVAAIYRFRESFVNEFLDNTNQEQTNKHMKSSYDQETSHVRPNGSFNAGPIQGTPTPFRVNMFDSYTV